MPGRESEGDGADGSATGYDAGQIIFDLGGGIQNDKKFKGVQLGGPSGGVIPAEYLNTPVDYDSIPPLGAIMGSGGMVVMDEDSCMVDVAKYFLDFTKGESCGKCISCRVGNPKVYDILCKISEGKATMNDLTILEELAGDDKKRFNLRPRPNIAQSGIDHIGLFQKRI